jgi:tetratricopeptide (TPR) repeat protein
MIPGPLVAPSLPESEWQTFCVTSLVNGSKAFKALIQTADPESEPYKSRYAAAEGQQKLIDAIGRFEEHQDHLYFDADGVHLTYHTILGRVLIRRGLALADTDLTQDCQECLKAGLQHLKRTQPCQDMYSMLVAFNSLGILLCNLGQLKEASACLTEAECAYHAIKNGITSTEGSQKLLHLEQDNDTDANDFCEELYTKTLFFSAQVHQNLGHVQKATEYCGATLQRQADAYGAQPYFSTGMVFQCTFVRHVSAQSDLVVCMVGRL